MGLKISYGENNIFETEKECKKTLKTASTLVEKDFTIESASMIDHNIRFWDPYTAELVEEWTQSTLSTATSLPPFPLHPEIEWVGWNWTLEDLKQYATVGADVGLYGHSSDGKFKIIIDAWNPRELDFAFWANLAGTIEFDWGDGSEIENITGKGGYTGKTQKLTSHTYSSIGQYIISIKVINGSFDRGYSETQYILKSENSSVSRNRYIKGVIGDSTNYSYGFEQLFIGAKCDYFIVGENFKANEKMNYGGAKVIVPLPNTASIERNRLTDGFSANIETCCFTKNITRLDYYSNLGNFKATKLNQIRLYVNSIPFQAFQSCHYLESVSAPNVTSIEGSAFVDCHNLKTVEIPEVTTIGNSAFSNCRNLSSIISSKITEIGVSSLSNTGLTEFNFYNIVTIGNTAFSGCKLKKIKLPKSCISIGNAAFSINYYLQEIDCTELTVINNEPSCTLLSSNVFGSNQLKFIFASEEIMNVYASATNWSTYANQMTYINN